MTNAEQVLRKLLDKIVEEQGIKVYDVAIQPISSGGANFTTRLYLVTITGDRELRLFAKVAAFGEKVREAVPKTIFTTERFFYTKLTKIYQEMEEKFNVPPEHRLSFTKFYGCNTNYLEETFVLENLVHQGFGDYNRHFAIDWPYAATAVGEIVKFHALSHAFKRHRTEEFESFLKILKFEWPLTDEQRDLFWGKGKMTAIDATRKENKERVENHLKKVMFNFENFLAPINTTVLIHGDYRVSNLLHKYNDDGTVTIKIVDYQLVQGGCPMADLVFFLITSTDEEFRKQHYQRLVDHYYEQLCSALKRLDIDPHEVYPRKMYDHELKEKLCFALQIAVFTLPLITIETEDAPVFDKDSDISSFAVEKTSKLYRERLNGVVNDCIKWGVL